MKKRIAFPAFMLLALAMPAMAESNFVEQFLSRYRAPSVSAPPAAAQNPLNDLIRNGTLPLTVGDMVNFVLQNNLDIGFNRLTPFSTQLLIESYYRPFEPTIRMTGSVARDTSPSRSQLTGAANAKQP